SLGLFSSFSPPVALMKFGLFGLRLARVSGLASQLVVVYETFLYSVTTPGPFHLYVVVTNASGLNWFPQRSPMVSPNIPNEAFRSVLPSPKISHAPPTLGTTSFQ